MIKHIRTLFFTYPEFEEEEETLRARILFELAWVLIAIGIIAIGFSFIPITYAPVYFKLGTSSVFLGVINILLLRRGWTRLLSIEIVMILTATFFILPFTFGGVSSASIAFQFTSVLLAFVLISSKGGGIVLLITILGNLTFLITEEIGIYIPTPPDPLPLTSFSVHTISLVFTSGVIFSFRTALDRMLKRFYISENNLTMRNRQLLSLQDVSIAFSDSLDFENVLSKITQEISGFTKIEGCSISEWNETDDTLIVIAAYFPKSWEQDESIYKPYKVSEYPATERVLIEQKTEQFQYRSANLDPAEKAYMEEEGLVMMLLVPMMYQGKTIGLVELEDSHVERTFSQEDINLIQVLANQAANAIVNARLFSQAQTELEERRKTEQDLERKNRQLFVLQTTNTTISSNNDLLETLNMVCTQLVNYFEIECCSISLWNKNKDAVQRIAYHYPLEWETNEVVDLFFNPYPLADFPNTKAVLVSSNPLQLHINDSTLTLIEKKYMETGGIASSLIVPLISQQGSIGIIELAAIEGPYDFSEGGILMIQQVAIQIANAIYRKQLFEQAQLEIAERTRAEQDLALQNERLIAIQKASALVNTTLDIKVTLKVLGKELVQLLNLEGCYIFEWNRNTNVLNSIGGYWPKKVGGDKFSESFYLDDYPFTRVIMIRQVPAFLRISQPNLDAAEKAYMKAEGVKTQVLLPMVYQGETIGIIELEDSNHERNLNDNDIALAKLITDQAAIAIINSRLFQETEKRLAEQIALRETVSFISSTLDINEVLRHITEQAVTALNCTSGYISLFEIGSDQYTVRGEFFAPEASGSELSSDLNVTYEEADKDFLAHLRQGKHKTVYFDELPSADPTRLHMEQYNAKTILFYPLILGNDLIGMLELWDSREKKLFSPADFRLGNDIAKQATIAINNASLYEQLQLQAEVLEERVKERTDELSTAYDDLLIAKVEAEEANKSKSTFLATMSHEIRTPINAVTGMTELLMNTPLNDQQVQLARNIMTGGDTLLALINNILDFSKIEAGRLELEDHPFVLRTCIEDAFDIVLQPAASKRLHITYNIEEDLPGAFFGDTTRIRQILVNLLSNAVKFTATGKVELYASTVKSAENNNNPSDEQTIFFSVSDTGIGIPEHRVSDLFNPFRQLDASTTREFGGTGLGLAITKRLVEAMGGRIWLESEFEIGTTFYFTITLPPAPFKSPEYLKPSQPLLKDKHILVAIPQKTNRFTLSRRFDHWGMVVDQAESRQEVKRKLEDHVHYDLLCIDEDLVDRAGVTLIPFIRRIHPDLPIIILETFGFNGSETDQLIFPVYKPIKPSELHRKLSVAVSVDSVKLKMNRSYQEDSVVKTIAEDYPQRILLVEDNDMNQDLILRVLSRLGYEATLANNGKEALDAFEVSTYDTVLMDIQMPVLDGVETTRRIRAQNSAIQQPYIIALTANAMTGDREAYLAVGMNDYISKPFRIKEIADSLLKAYRGNNHPSENRTTILKKEIQTDNPDANEAPIFESKAIEQLRNMLGHQADAMLPTLMEKFSTQIPEMVTTANEAYAANDMNELRRAVHTIKSNSANFGAVRLSEHARDIEKAVREGTLINYETRIEGVQEAFSTAKKQIEKYLSENR